MHTDQNPSSQDRPLTFELPTYNYFLLPIKSLLIVLTVPDPEYRYNPPVKAATLKAV
jgi:hypothetical protein